MEKTNGVNNSTEHWYAGVCPDTDIDIIVIITARSNNDSDVAPEFEAAMSELRIPLDHSLPGKPNNNSLAERTNQEIINTVSTAMLHAGLPAQYWNFSLNCVTHNLNIEDVEGDGDSAWKRMTGDDFKGKAIPSGEKVFLKPTDTRDKTYHHGPNVS